MSLLLLNRKGCVHVSFPPPIFLVDCKAGAGGSTDVSACVFCVTVSCELEGAGVSLLKCACVVVTCELQGEGQVAFQMSPLELPCVIVSRELENALPVV